MQVGYYKLGVYLIKPRKGSNVLCLDAQPCPTLCDPMDCRPASLLCPWGFSRQKYWSGLPYPPPGDLLNPGIEPRSPTLQVVSLPLEPPGKPQRIYYYTLYPYLFFFLMEKRFLSHIQQNGFCIATKRYGKETRQEKLQALHLNAKNTIVIYYNSDYDFLTTIFTFDDQCLKLLFLYIF